MTRQEAIRNHREMWRWLAKNPGKWKMDYLMRYDPEVKLLADCYLCEYTDENHNGECEYCLVEWPVGPCYCYDGLYSTWESAMKRKNYAHAGEIAKQISELPEKEKIK